MSENLVPLSDMIMDLDPVTANRRGPRMTARAADQ